MPFVSITRLRLRSWRYLPLFAVYAVRSARQAKSADGNLGSRLLRERRNIFWTATLWTSSQTMKAFMLSGAHRAVMPKLAIWCDEAAVAHWTQENGELPSWAEAHRRLRKEGRLSKVNNPSPAHTAFEFPEPDV